MKLKIILLLVPIFLFIYTPTIFAGCFSRDWIISDVKVEPETECIQTWVYNTCIWTLELRLISKCNETYLVKDEKDELIYVIKTNNNPPIEKRIEEINNNDTIKDINIPQEIWKWKRVLINKENPENTITIYWEHKYKIIENKDYTNNKKSSISINPFVVLFIIIWFILFLSFFISSFLWFNFSKTKKISTRNNKK